MFTRFLKKAAAKASLVNIKFDIGQLGRSLPHNPRAATKAVLSLIENISLAFTNQSTPDEVRRAAAEALASQEDYLQGIVIHTIALAEASRDSNSARLELAEDNMQSAFHRVTGSYLDRSQVPSRFKLAMKDSQRQSPPPTQVPLPTKQSDYGVGVAFRDKVLERLRSGEIVADLEKLRQDGNTQFGQLILEQLREQKRALDLLARYGATDDVKRMLRLIDHILEDEAMA